MTIEDAQEEIAKLKAELELERTTEKTVIVNYRMPVSLKDAIAGRAALEGVTSSQLVRVTLAKSLGWEGACRPGK